MPYNPNVEKYDNMSIEDLQKEYDKPGIVTEDKSLILHTIASKRASNNNVISKPADAAPVLPAKDTTGKK